MPSDPMPNSYLNSTAKRSLDIALVAIAMPVWIPLFLTLYVVVLLSTGFPVIFWSQRVGKNGVLFNLPKLRTLARDTPLISTEELSSREVRYTPFGKLLRRSSLDELPQLFCVLKGTMSLVGPRPALPRQTYLNNLRGQQGVDRATPGMTGWAQINGRDELSDDQKLLFDAEYAAEACLWKDVMILWRTIALSNQGVSH